MSAWPVVAAALAAGFAVSRLLAGGGRSAGPDLVVLWSLVVSGVWMGFLDLVGVDWTWPVLMAPGLAAVPLLPRAFRRPLDPRGERSGPESIRDRWRRVLSSPYLVGASLIVATNAVIVGLRPAFGWDFRYNWGLKARVFALAGGHDWAWLSWPGHIFAHPDYPPLWPDLLAGATTLGAGVGWAAAAWTAVLVVGLSCACWRAAASAPAPVRALAAVVGGWAPVIFADSASASGYAEPLLAFLAAVALALLAGGDARSRGQRTALIGAVAALALTKNEGCALALGVALAAWVRPAARRDPLPMAAALLSCGVWRVLLVLAGVSGEPAILDWERALGRAADMPGALVVMAGPGLIVILPLWAAAAVTVRGRGAGAVWLALSVWALAVLGAYLVSPHDLAWHLSTSLERLLAVPLPVLLALGLARTQEGGGGTGTKQAGRRWSSSRP